MKIMITIVLLSQFFSLQGIKQANNSKDSDWFLVKYAEYKASGKKRKYEKSQQKVKKQLADSEKITIVRRIGITYAKL